MSNKGFQTLAKLAHNPTRNFDLETEFGLRLDVTGGRFRARMAELESSDLQDRGDTGPVSRVRLYKLEPVFDNEQIIWLIDSTSLRATRPEKSDLETRYPKFSKDWTEALLEWEETGRDLDREKITSQQRSTLRTSRQWNSWVFQGGMLACWLAIQDDVQSVIYRPEDRVLGSFGHDNAGDEIQRFVKGYPWSKM